MLKKQDQRGATLVFAMLLLMVIFAIGALVVDLLRVERASRSLQRAADAAALAGAAQFNRPTGNFSTDASPVGWLRAKRAAIAALRMNPIFGDSEEITQSAVFGGLGGDQNIIEGPGSYAFTDYDFPKLHVRIERVFYYRDLFDFQPKELPLETRGDTCNDQAMSPPGVPDSCCTNSVLVFRVANAVRVTLTLKDLPFYFGQFVGIGQLATLTRTALGAADIPSPTDPVESCPP